MIGRYLNSGAVKICNRLFKVYIIFHFFLKLETNTDYKKSMIEEVFLWNWKMFSKKESRNCCSRKGFPSTPWHPDGSELHDHQEYPIWEKLQSNDPHYFSAQFCLWIDAIQILWDRRIWKSGIGSRWTQAAPGQERRRTAEGIRKLQFC